MDEFKIIRRYFERAHKDENVIVGIGDDAAVLRPAAGRELLLVVDTLVAGVHFPVDLPAEDIGYRCVAVNLSDIAAMGGRPRWMTLALTMLQSDSHWLEGFARGLFQAADEYDVTLVGGDTTAGSELVVSIQLTGDAAPACIMTRHGARPGDGIYVSGSIGDASAGLAFLQSGVAIDKDAEFLVQRFCRPDARIAFGAAIAPHASAAIDISDGLFTDVEKLLAASGVSGVIELADIPMSRQMRTLMETDDALRFALGGGDDYELCFTSPAAPPDLQAATAACDVALTKIGEVGVGTGLRCNLDGADYEYHHKGYRHFH